MRFPKKTSGETKVHKTLTMTVSFWAMVEQIRSKQGLDTADEAIFVSVRQLARKIGIEAWPARKEEEPTEYTRGKYRTVIYQVMDFVHFAKLGGIDNEFSRFATRNEL